MRLFVIPKLLEKKIQYSSERCNKAKKNALFNSQTRENWFGGGARGTTSRVHTYFSSLSARPGEKLNKTICSKANNGIRFTCE